MKQNKTIFAGVILSAVALLSGALALAGCDGGCDHKNAGRTEEVKATCTEAGERIVYCLECDEVRFREVIPALGHNYYENGILSEYCANCGEPDPDNSSFVGDSEFGSVNLSEGGVLSWNRLRSAVKYELSVTYSGSDVPEVYEIDKKYSSLNLEEMPDGTAFPVGKTSAKLVPYGRHTETVDGEQISQEYPMTELTDEFRVTKLNGKYSIVRMKYTDDNLTLNGFYSDIRQDDDGKEYYQYDLVLKDNKATQFNVSSYVKLKSGYSAKYYKSESDRDSGSNEIDSMNMRFQYINAGGNNIYYMRVFSSGTTVADYDLKIYGLRTVKLSRLKVKPIYDQDGYRTDEYENLGSLPAFTEGDIIPTAQIFGGLTDNYARDDKYNLITTDADFVVTAPSAGDTLNIYFGDSVSSDCYEYNNMQEYFDMTETSYGWLLSSDENKREINSLPAKLMDKKILNITLNNIRSQSLDINSDVKELNLQLINCTELKQVNIYSPDTIIKKAAFEGANSEMTIRLKFYEGVQTAYETGWNRKSATHASLGSYEVIYWGS